MALIFPILFWTVRWESSVVFCFQMLPVAKFLRMYETDKKCRKMSLHRPYLGRQTAGCVKWLFWVEDGGPSSYYYKSKKFSFLHLPSPTIL